jgi:N-acyl amino acid synthase of PEP-CTERM/exosortase system
VSQHEHLVPGDEQNLSSTIAHYFKIELTAHSPLAQASYRLRHDVYCAELGHESPRGENQNLEYDDYDSRSLHVSITDIRTGEIAACVRLVLASEADSLPLEDFCLESLYWPQIEILQQRNAVAELSRLAVARPYRRRLLLRHESTEISLLPAQLAYLSGIALAHIARRTQLYAMMESQLPRLLLRAGIGVEQVGDPVQYHGLRTAHKLVCSDFAAQLPTETARVYGHVFKELRNQYENVTSKNSWAA